MDAMASTAANIHKEDIIRDRSDPDDTSKPPSAPDDSEESYEWRTYEWRIVRERVRQSVQARKREPGEIVAATEWIRTRLSAKSFSLLQEIEELCLSILESYLMVGNIPENAKWVTGYRRYDEDDRDIGYDYWLLTRDLQTRALHFAREISTLREVAKKNNISSDQDNNTTKMDMTLSYLHAALQFAENLMKFSYLPDRHELRACIVCHMFNRAEINSLVRVLLDFEEVFDGFRKYTSRNHDTEWKLSAAMKARDNHQDQFPRGDARDILLRWISKCYSDWQQREGGVTQSQETLRTKWLKLASGLQHVSPRQTTLRIERYEPGSISNRMKGYIEAQTHKIWDWWPLQPYTRPLNEDECRLTWTSIYGDMRCAAVPKGFAWNLIVAKELAPDSIHPTQLSTQTQSTSSASSSIVESSGSVPEPPAQAPVVTNIRPATTKQLAPLSGLHVFLVVYCETIFSKSYKLTQSSIQSMISPAHPAGLDLQFFHWLRREYYACKGFFASWFDIMTYSHCEYFKFQNLQNGECAPWRYGFPSHEDTSYEFDPKPMLDDPAIPPYTFYSYFYQSGHTKSVLRRLQRAIRRDPFRRQVNNVIISRLPKRTSPLEENAMLEEFWGLYAVEAIAFRRVFVYCCVFLSPCIGFFFAWLFAWGHFGDLQNASVPFSISLPLFAMLSTWIILPSSRTGGKLKVE